MTTFWTKADIEAKLATDDRWVARAILLLFANQTDDEKFQMTTRHLNDKGFLPYHARMFSSFARKIKQYGNITPNQAAYARRKGIHKYAGTQLLKAANNALESLDAQIEAAKQATLSAEYLEGARANREIDQTQLELAQLRTKRMKLSPPQQLNKAA